MSEESSMDIDYVANLARIELTSQEKEKFQGQLGDVLKYFEKLQEVDVEGLNPLLMLFLVLMFGIRIWQLMGFLRKKHY